MFLCRLQNSYTASQRTNQELEDKLHTLVICPGVGAAWGHFGWHCAHSIVGGWDLPGKCHCALGLGEGAGQWRARDRSVLCESGLS